ncbi:hypothetical protein HDV05_002204 [Chytridiales sp. JEL 0842]|nr:hypothetical protein HDV05_002204 [Chytridiales sp. JEL 0842]
MQKLHKRSNTAPSDSIQSLQSAPRSRSQSRTRSRDASLKPPPSHAFLNDSTYSQQHERKTGTLHVSDLGKLLVELNRNASLTVEKMADEGRLARQINDIQQAYLARKDDIRAYHRAFKTASAAAASRNTINNTNASSTRLKSSASLSKLNSKAAAPVDSSADTLAAGASNNNLNIDNNQQNENIFFSPALDHGTNLVQHAMYETYRFAWILNENLVLVATSKGGIKGTLLSITNPISVKRKKVQTMFQDLHDAWQNLMTQLALAIARTSSGTAQSINQNLHKLAVATGAPDWEDLTVDDGKSLFMKAEKHMLGIGVPKSYDLAFKTYTAASRCGNPSAIHMLGHLHEHGLGTPRDTALALKHYKEAAALGNADSMNCLGKAYEAGKGVAVDISHAGSWYLRAAEKGNVDAMTNLGYILENGIGQDPNPELAVDWYRMAATQGYARAQNCLGSCYYRGFGVEQDYGEAVAWYRKAGEQGNPHAQNNLGICYEEGLGVAKDMAMAKSLYKAASEQRHPSATNNLGYMHLLEVSPPRFCFLNQTLGY